MDFNPSLLALIPILPLIGFVLNGCFGNRMGRQFVSIVGCALPITSFVIAFRAFQALRGSESEAIRHTLFEWIHVGSFQVDMAFTFDGLSAVMCLVVTGIGSLIHLYSTGYMRGDKSYARFFAYLNLFTAFMLMLVLGDNLLVLFVGWEGVGLCSYLLIGFWHEDAANCDAGRKAFIFNRVGDLGFLIGVFLIFTLFGSVNFAEILVGVESISDVTAPASSLNSAMPMWGTVAIGTLITAITLCLFVGATGKSAQIPLFPWLPDAMAGPTPVSALIHAATMVTSGVYLCCRLMPLFSLSPQTLGVIAAIGACTALLAALIALSQTDIKKVLAYSTVSQLGYMFFAIGMGAYSAALFHVVTHAFFKALLFLGSGSVIHAMHHEQDMRKMGGLRRQLPFTHLIFIIGTLAIAGVPFFSGFFSKDEILFSGFFAAFHGHDGHVHFQDQLFWGMATLTAGLTAFYMLRMVALTFWGKSNVDDKLVDHVHEPGGWMPFSLAVLAVLSVFGGILNVPELLHWLPFVGEERTFLLGNFTGLHHAHTGIDLDALHKLEWTSLIISVGVGATGLAAAWYLYGPGRALLDGFVNGAGKKLVRISENKFYIDEVYQILIVTPFQFASYVMFILIDRFLIDGVMVGGSALVVRSFGEFFRRMQSGFVPAYLLTFGCGALVLLFIMMSLLNGAG